MHKQKNFIYKNEEFLCDYCQTQNSKPERGIRNHCKQCLCSKHVDLEIPGDRESECQGRMVPIRIKSDKKREWVITHLCERCKETSNNMIQSDDNHELIAKLVHNTNLQNLS